jgi:hypothetical protein
MGTEGKCSDTIQTQLYEQNASIQVKVKTKSDRKSSMLEQYKQIQGVS